MRQDLTYIAVVLDQSGSMEVVREATIEGFNAFLAEQKTAPGDALFRLVRFNNYIQPSADFPIGVVEPLTTDTYRPNNGTALYDAIGSTIDAVGTKLATMREEDRPAKVIVMIQTDGHENASREYSRSRVKQMMQHQREKYSWEFVFVGTTEAAMSDARDLGVLANKMTSYTGDSVGTANVLRAMSAGTTHYRGMVLNNASEQELVDMSYFTPPAKTK